MDAASIALRLLVYLHSGMLLAVLLFAQPWTLQTRRAVMGIAVTGIVLCLLGIAILASSFAESGSLFDLPAIRMIMIETATGWAAIARIAALIAVAVLVRSDRYRLLAAAFAMTATATLLWNGHGATTDGALGWLHLGGNAVHLVSGLGWIGAVAAFLWAAFRSANATPHLQARLERFATIGTILVALLLITGIANALFIVGWGGVAGATATTYGKLLLTKIALFVTMLVAAAVNRFLLTPRLSASGSLVALRVSLGTELLLGCGVLALVAWLGTLDPAQ
jgi:copper resistance protein D